MPAVRIKKKKKNYKPARVAVSQAPERGAQTSCPNLCVFPLFSLSPSTLLLLLSAWKGAARGAANPVLAGLKALLNLFSSALFGDYGSSLTAALRQLCAPLM